MVEPWQAGPQPLTLALLRRLLTAAWWRGYERRAGPARDGPRLAYRVGDPSSWWT